MVSPFLYFKGTIQPYLLNTSSTMRRYLNPLFHLLNCCISTKSEHHISSIWLTITRRRVKLRFIDLCNSSANFSCQFSSLDGLSRFLASFLFLHRDLVSASCRLEIVLFDPILASGHKESYQVT